MQGTPPGTATQLGVEVGTRAARAMLEMREGDGFDNLKNELGPCHSSGRRRPVPIAGLEHVLPLDTLIVAVGEQPAVESIRSTTSEEFEIKMTDWGSTAADPRTMATSRKGLFAGGDVVTGPNTVVDAIAAGKTAAVMIDRYLLGEAQRNLAIVPGRAGGPPRSRSVSAL